MSFSHTTLFFCKRWMRTTNNERNQTPILRTISSKAFFLEQTVKVLHVHVQHADDALSTFALGAMLSLFLVFAPRWKAVAARKEKMRTSTANRDIATPNCPAKQREMTREAFGDWWQPWQRKCFAGRAGYFYTFHKFNLVWPVWPLRHHVR